MILYKKGKYKIMINLFFFFEILIQKVVNHRQ